MSHALHREEHRALSLTLAVLMHGLIAALLYFGVHWQTHSLPPVMQVEMWSPPPPAPVLVEQPKPQPRVIEQPVEQPTPEPVPNPDIALEQKPQPKKPEPVPQPTVKPKPVKEPAPQQPKQKAETKPSPNPAKSTQNAQTSDKFDIDKSFRFDPHAFQTAPALGATLARVGAQEANARARELDQYLALVSNVIRRNLVYSDDMGNNPEVVLSVTVLPDMTVLEDSIKVLRSSGIPNYDDAARRALIRTARFPDPPADFDRNTLRHTTLKFRLHGD